VELTAADSVPTASIDISTDNDQLPVLPTPLLRRRSDEKTELSPVTARQRSWSTRRFARFRSLKTAYNKIKYNTRKSRLFSLFKIRLSSSISTLNYYLYTVKDRHGYNDNTLTSFDYFDNKCHYLRIPIFYVTRH